MFDFFDLAASNLLNPAVLFFSLGAAAALLRSDLVIPREMTAGLALYLMMAIGFRGGAEIAHAGFTPQVGAVALAAVGLGLAIPTVAFPSSPGWAAWTPSTPGRSPPTTAPSAPSPSPRPTASSSTWASSSTASWWR